jgi:hypothetical protein
LSFSRTTEGLYVAPGLRSIPGIEHAFGTRHARPAATLRTLKQIHSILARDASECDDGAEGDILMTDQAGLWIAVKTADCVPILIAACDGRSVAAVHAGWRGAAAGVATHAVRAMTRRYGVRATDLHAAIGPSIGPCCYRVGPEVAARFPASFVKAGVLDLWSATRQALLDAGIPAAQIESANLCTRCREDEFQSWRRDGPRAGRMFSALRIAPR